MKTKLYDFSVSSAVTVCAAYAVLLSIFGFTWADGGGILPAVIFILIAVSFLLVFVFFVVLAPKITSKALTHGTKTIKKKNLCYKAAYDKRLKEKVIVFWDKKTEIKYLSNAEYKKKTIRVQATDANLSKVGLWLGCEIPAPEKPKKKKTNSRK